MDDVINLSSDSEATVRAGPAARRRAAREALAAQCAAKKLAAAVAKKQAIERAVAAKEVAKQSVATREAAAIAIRGNIGGSKYVFPPSCYCFITYGFYFM